MDKQTILQGIAAMQRIQEGNPPASEKWQRASEVMRVLVGKLNGTAITTEMWDAGATR